MVVGSEVVAAAIYCEFWLPNAPAWIWIAGFSVLLILVNTLSIENFGSIEYWFAMIKVVTIVAFLILGAMLLFGLGFPRIGLTHFTAHDGFSPHGWRGVGLGESPFVRVFERVGIPAASHVMNFVVLSAALSSALCNLYFTARMLFSLARGGFAPALLGKLSKKGMPVAAVLASSVGMAMALVLAQIFQRTAFVFLIGVAFFGGPFIWLMTLATHVAFRLRVKKENRTIARIAPLGIWSSTFGILALLAVLVSTCWIPDFHVALLSGPPWLVFLTVCYFIWQKFQPPKSAAGAAPHG